jgi:hypothetical protein
MLIFNLGLMIDFFGFSTDSSRNSFISLRIFSLKLYDDFHLKNLQFLIFL